MLRVLLNNCVPLENHWKIKAGGLASELHVNTSPVIFPFDESRREETNTTGSSRFQKKKEEKMVLVRGDKKRGMYMECGWKGMN